MEKTNNEETNKISIVDIFFMSVLAICYIVALLTGFLK